MMKNILFSFLLLSVFSCHSQTEPASSKGPEEFSSDIAGGNIQLLDVRKATEYKSGHLKAALQADWTNKNEFFERIKYVDKDKPVYVYCLAGGRSAAAAEWMRTNGFKQVVELKGGINAWKGAGKPVEGSSSEKQITPDEFAASIPTNKTVLVDFGAEWCPPCIKMEPVLTEIKNDPTLKFDFIKIDAGVHTDLMKNMNIEAIPVFIVYKNGKEIWRKQGLVSKEELKSQLK